MVPSVHKDANKLRMILLQHLRTRCMIHNKIHLIRTGCPRSSIALQWPKQLLIISFFSYSLFPSPLITLSAGSIPLLLSPPPDPLPHKPRAIDVSLPWELFPDAQHVLTDRRNNLRALFSD